MNDRSIFPNRRRFIKSAVGSGVAGAIGSAVGRRTSLAATNHGERVVVIGAGVAGLMAAKTLQSHGRIVTVIDARDRIGGRVWTADLGGTPVDLGAQWIEGINGNPLTEFCRREKIKTARSNEESIRVFDSDGSRFGAEEASGLNRWCKEVLQRLEEFSESNSNAGQSDMTIAEALRRLDAGREATDRQRRFLKWAVALNVEATEGDDADRLSLRNYQTDEETESFDGPQHILPAGFGQITKLLAAGLDIRLGRRATSVLYEAGGVRVVCEGEEFQADRAVVTLPLGVLKAGHVKFHPNLPKRKLAAIAALGVAAAHKVVLRFPRRFWDNETDFLGSVSEDGARFVEWTDLSRTTDAPILSLWSHGRAARQLEQFNHVRATDEAMTAIRRVFGRSAPDPESVAVTSWINDPSSQGCYVNLPVGASHDDLDALAAPVDNRLFFAGEATSRRHRGTVHGAWLSGLRAAEEIVALRT
jgi:monoamine oxidase